MAFELPDLPYSLDALEPVMSGETLRFHHGKHHSAYVEKLNALIQGTEWEQAPLEAILLGAGGTIFNNAGQHHNHSFFWRCMCPPGSGRQPAGRLASRLETDFGSLDELKQVFLSSGNELFGSGWVWLVKTANSSLAVVQTQNGDTPLRDGATPLLVCDVWEHAYYVDYRNDRKKFLEGFWGLVDWDFVGERYEAALKAKS